MFSAAGCGRKGFPVAAAVGCLDFAQRAACCVPRCENKAGRARGFYRPGFQSEHVPVSASSISSSSSLFPLSSNGGSNKVDELVATCVQCAIRAVGWVRAETLVAYTTPQTWLRASSASTPDNGALLFATAAGLRPTPALLPDFLFFFFFWFRGCDSAESFPLRRL